MVIVMFTLLKLSKKHNYFRIKINESDHLAIVVCLFINMGRPKRKLSPLKSDTKLRKLSAFGFGSITGNSGQNKENLVENTENLSDSLSKSTESVQPGEEADHSVSQTNASRQKAAVKRHFRSEWLHNRDWLLYDAVKKQMFCSICKQAQLVNSFTTGCSSLKLD